MTMEIILTVVVMAAIFMLGFGWGVRWYRWRSQRIYLKAEQSWRRGVVPSWPREWRDWKSEVLD